ncbi:glycosyltransferase family 4 protein [Salegentibacter sp. F188]|uniref:Glycosyltransferase family 4 protein n=1 Tax=Autumnicola patrickiae TaxID=3075591 RepID=A0ABU3E3G6_9FLAO|nr:glycosyltransferase family 4 protein [Salegentibacter sp. F188]MDT0690532.1 glycosyltransferase family 4 protein [Salegentibacter sp. F188]
MKKVLIITYYWPPAGGPGVQRWLKFVKYLAEFDIEPVVYIPANPTYPLTDKSLASEVPENVQVVQKDILEPYSLAKLFSKKDTETISSGIIAKEGKQNFLQKMMLYIRGNFFIPDARKFWIKPSVKFLKKFLKEQQINTIITTGPPHSLHLIGLQLKKDIEISWFADFRDPWTQIGYHDKLKLSKASEKKHLALEKEVLNAADQIITTSFTTKQEFQNKTAKPVTVITNGFDEKPTKNGIQLDKKFSFSHIGSLLSGRNPENLWKCLGELISENKSFADDFMLNLVGAVSEEVLDSIKAAGLKDHLTLQKYVPHFEAIKLQRKSQVLLLIEIDSRETQGIIPGKVFEYLSAKRPILALGPEKWDICQILDETLAGTFFLYSEKEELKQHILNLYSQFKKGRLEVNSRNIENYHRKTLTGNLANLLKQN